MTEEKKTYQWIVTFHGIEDQPDIVAMPWDYPVRATTKPQAVTKALSQHFHVSKTIMTKLRKATTCVKVKTPRLGKAPLLKEPCPLCHKEGIEKWDYPEHWEACQRTYKR